MPELRDPEVLNPGGVQTQVILGMPTRLREVCRIPTGLSRLCCYALRADRLSFGTSSFVL